MKSPIDLYVSRKVTERRKALGLSQAEIGLALGVSASFIGKVESEKHPNHYNVKHLNALAVLLKCSMADFLPKKPLKG